MEELLTVREVVRMTGVSERTLYLYGKSGLVTIALSVSNGGGECCARLGWRRFGVVETGGSLPFLDSIRIH